MHWFTPQVFEQTSTKVVIEVIEFNKRCNKPEVVIFHHYYSFFTRINERLKLVLRQISPKTCQCHIDGYLMRLCTGCRLLFTLSKFNMAAENRKQKITFERKEISARFQRLSLCFRSWLSHFRQLRLCSTTADYLNSRRYPKTGSRNNF